LIIVALIAGTVGCVGGDGDDGWASYTLIVDFTTGGTVTVNDVPIPGKAILTYAGGTAVSLNATPNSGYQFVGWTGDVLTIGDAHASETIIVVNGDYSIMANFELPPPVKYSLNIIGPAYGSVTVLGKAGLCMRKEQWSPWWQNQMMITSLPGGPVMSILLPISTTHRPPLP
jgi:uncharacterized repeat protein (TIGR02543 family)